MAKVFIEEATLTAIGDAIRGKEGTSDLVPVNDMASRITSLPSGGGDIEVEPIVLKGQCQYTCANTVASAYIEKFGNTITTTAIESASRMFQYFSGSVIPFEVNMKSGTSHAIDYLFYSATKLTELPKVNNAKPNNVEHLFDYCARLRVIPEDFIDTWDFTSLNTSTSASTSGVFSSCYSLRKLPDNILKNAWSKATTQSKSSYYYLCTNCYALDELVNLFVRTQVAITTNQFYNTFNGCNRLKNLTFEVQEDGTPYTAQWKGQTIDLTKNFGYTVSNNNIIGYNSGITADKEVKDDATYQALKNDPDWFTLNVAYSRYNHDSAIATINSLPDTSAYLAEKGGTNTIKFLSAAGEKTDGGAINTLTEEEIAVAAAKGWTVSLV